MVPEQDILSRLKLVSQQWQFSNSSESFFDLAVDYQKLINRQLKANKTPIIFLAEKQTNRFLAAFFASVITKSCLFLLNPDWQLSEWQQVEKIALPDIIFGNIDYPFPEVKQGETEQNISRFSGIMISTGGTSGQIKFAIHTWETLVASAEGFWSFFDFLPLHFYSCLPLYHVSGLMPVIRSLISGSKLVVTSFAEFKNNLFKSTQYHDFFISLIPTQLQFILSKNPLFLTQFKLILVGGATTSLSQISLAKTYNIPLALTYGMTETASGITILKPEKLRINHISNGQVLPHIKISIAGKKEGIIKVKSKSLFKGYYPHYEAIELFATDDIGYLDEEQNLHIIGRNSQKIITGGKNVFPLEVEKVILATELVKDVHIVGEKDDYWGQIIVAFYVPQIHKLVNQEIIKKEIKSKISSYKIPKKWIQVTHIPRNNQGKIFINRDQ